jgi:hypothetical protein
MFTVVLNSPPLDPIWNKLSSQPIYSRFILILSPYLSPFLTTYYLHIWKPIIRTVSERCTLWSTITYHRCFHVTLRSSLLHGRDPTLLLGNEVFQQWRRFTLLHNNATEERQSCMAGPLRCSSITLDTEEHKNEFFRLLRLLSAWTQCCTTDVIPCIYLNAPSFW